MSVYHPRVPLNFDYTIITFKGQVCSITSLFATMSPAWKVSNLGRLEIFTSVKSVVLIMWSYIGRGHLMTYFLYSTRC